jgi:tetratricopeptide (TPR) repeat protein
LTSLVDKSLVIYEADKRGARYRLLETVRQYARDRLLEAGEDKGARGRHARFYLALAEEAAPHLSRAWRNTWVERLDAEHDNLRAALAWSQSEEEEGETGLRLVGALHWFWYFRSYFREGEEWARSALARTEEVAHLRRTKARAGSLYAGGIFHWHRGDYVTARSLLAESAAIWRDLEDKSGLARALMNLGLAARDQGDYPAARTHLEECVQIAPEAKDPWTPAWALLTLGTVVYREGESAAARSLYERALILARELEDPWLIAWSLINLGDVARRMGDSGQAMGLYRECLTLFCELGNRQSMAYALEALASLIVAQGELERGARLFGAAEALREAIGARMSPADFAEYADSVAALRVALGEQAFAAAWAEGRATPLEQAIASALQSRDA